MWVNDWQECKREAGGKRGRVGGRENIVLVRRSEESPLQETKGSFLYLMRVLRTLTRHRHATRTLPRHV